MRCEKLTRLQAGSLRIGHGRERTESYAEKISITTDLAMRF